MLCGDVFVTDADDVNGFDKVELNVRLFLRQLEGETGSLNAPMEKVHQRGVELIPVQRYLTDGEGMLRILLRSPGTLSAFCSGIWKTMEVTAGEQSLEWDLSNNN